MAANSETFILENFEGPLDLLWHLVTRQEIDIYQISILEIIEQYLSKKNDWALGSEFIALAASFVWFKSKTLLPKHEQQQEQNLEEETDPHFDIIHQLVDYCRFKQAAKELSERQLQQGAFYPRGIESGEAKKKLGIDHLSLDDLSQLFQEILAKSSPKTGIIEEEEWKVSDKIFLLRQCLIKQKVLDFFSVFDIRMSRIELIVTFLALLEMMKSGEARVARDSELNTICIFSKSLFKIYDQNALLP